MRKSWKQRGAAPAELKWIDKALDADVLTIGFARRVPSYKRLTLMLRDPERLKRLLLHPERPVQLVIAGKSHPADEGGKKLIQEMVRFADDPEVRHRIVFLPNYDIAMAQPLYPGCDVWLNNPLRPYEACGTSGMKAALNGGLNLSILDGWWDEWYDGNNGWSIPSADGVDDADHRDDIEADRALRPDRERGRAAVLRRGRGGHAGPLDRDGAAHAEVARPQGARRPDGPRLRHEALQPVGAELARPSTATTPARRSSPTGSTRSARAGPAWPSTTSSPAASPTPPSSARPSRSARSCRSASSRPRTSTCRSCTAGSSTRTTWSTRRVASLALAETYEAGRHRFEGTVALATTGPFGYTVRVLPEERAPGLDRPSWAASRSAY